MPGRGPELVITDRCTFDFDETSKEMTLRELAPGESVSSIEAEVGWSLKVSPIVQELKPPMEQELDIIRNELDPQGSYR